MRVTIAGTGAMACLFGAKLAPFAEVTLLGTWEQGIAAIRERGIILEEGEQETRVRVGATCAPSDCAGTELALVLVKSWQTDRAARQLAGCLVPDGLALTLQNGLGNLEQMQALLGPERSALGVTAQGATLLGPGHVRMGGKGPTDVGEHPRAQPAVSLLLQAGFETRLAGRVESLVWGKLVINAGINALTALMRIPNGALLESPELTDLMEAAARETAAVAAAKGIALLYPDPAARVREVARATAANRSSMLQDVLRGAPTESDAINGAVMQEGERLGVPTPVNEVLWKLMGALALANFSIQNPKSKTENPQ